MLSCVVLFVDVRDSVLGLLAACCLLLCLQAFGRCGWVRWLLVGVGHWVRGHQFCKALQSGTAVTNSSSAGVGHLGPSHCTARQVSTTNAQWQGKQHSFAHQLMSLQFILLSVWWAPSDVQTLSCWGCWLRLAAHRLWLSHYLATESLSSFYLFRTCFITVKS